MEIKIAEKDARKEFLKTQKEAFPNLNTKKQSEYFDLKVKSGEMFILLDGKNYAGHICFGRHLFNPPFARGAFIEELAVKKQFQGKGYGKKLVLHLIKYCKNKKINMMYTSTGDYINNKSMLFWKKLGFKKVGKLKDINPHSEYKYGQIFLAMVLE